MSDWTFRPPDPFRCEVRVDGDAATVHPAGELDLDTVDEVQQRLAELRERGCRDVLLDLRGLTFMDSTGLRLVIQWDAAARDDGFTFAVVPGNGPVLRLLRLSGIDTRLTLRDG